MIDYLSQNVPAGEKKELVNKLIAALDDLSTDDRRRLMTHLKRADNGVYNIILNNDKFNVEFGGFKRSKKSRRSRK